MLTYALVEGTERGGTPVWWALAVAVAALFSALAVESRVADPILPLRLFKRRNFAAANAVTLLVYAALSGSTFFLILYLQSVIGYSPFEASLATIPISIVIILLAGRFGRLADERGPRLSLTIGPALLAAGMLLWTLVDDRDSWWALAAGVLAFGLGLAVTVAPITATALSAAPERLAGIAAGVNNTVSRVGGLIAVALVGLVISAVFTARVDGVSSRPLTEAPATEAARDAAVDAFRAGITLAAFLAILGAVIAALAISNRDAKAPEEPAVA